MLGLLLFPAKMRNIPNSFFYRLRRDPVFFIVFYLLCPPSFSLTQRALHRSRNFIRIHNHKRIHISRAPTDGLDQRTFTPQKALLVGIQNRNQTHFRQIQSISKQVDTNQHIKFPEPQIPQNLYSFNRLNIRMQIANSYIRIAQKFGQILRAPFRQSGNQNPFPYRRPFRNFF